MVQKFCIRRTDGKVYPWTQALSRRADMTSFRGTLEEAEAKGKEIMRLEASMRGADEEFETAPTIHKDPAPTMSDEELRTAKIIAAIKSLDTENNMHFTQAGVPRVEAIETVTGMDIEAWERDKALARMKA